MNMIENHPVTGSHDPIHVLACRLHDQPGARLFALCRASLAARLAADAAAAGYDEAEDLGPDALLLCQAANRGDWSPGDLLIIGIAQGNEWVRWNPPAPVEPVPGSPGATARNN
jgi:hypothetical protein